MQTFLPYPDFMKSAKCLDYKRLGKQRVEAKQILDILLGRTKTKGWRNHPAVLMWKDHVTALQIYYNTILNEWIERGYNNNMEHEYLDVLDLATTRNPSWLTEEFCASHRSNLLRKDPEWYGKYGWQEPDDLPYIWPT